jgi:O-antigen/teichoic acid export membrane protein
METRLARLFKPYVWAYLKNHNNIMLNRSSNFSSNVLKLITGSVFAQSLGIIVAPIVTRLFLPEAFGIAAIFISITSIIGSIACLRYELSIMLPESDEDATNLLAVCLCSVLIVAAISSASIWVYKYEIVHLLNAPELEKYFWLIPFMVSIGGIYMSLNLWNSRAKRFGQVSIINVISSTVTQSSKLGFGFSGYCDGGALIVATVLGRFFSTLILIAKIWHQDCRLFKAGIRWKKMISGLKKYKKFPLFSTWSVLLNSASHQLPFWILAFYFSPKVVGFFAFAKTVVSLPMDIAGQAVAQVFFQKASEVHNHDGKLPILVEKVFEKLVSIGLYPILMLILIGKDVFTVLFGERWAEAGVYVQLLGPMVFFRFISSPISTLSSVLEKQGFGLIVNILLFVSWCVSLIVGGMTGNIKFTLFLYSICGAAIYGGFCLWLITAAGESIISAVSQIIKYIIYSSPVLIIICLAKWLFRLNEIGILLVGLFTTFVYYTVIITKDKELKETIWVLFQKFAFIK